MAEALDPGKLTNYFIDRTRWNSFEPLKDIATGTVEV
jgi:hypothetical protein